MIIGSKFGSKVLIILHKVTATLRHANLSF